MSAPTLAQPNSWQTRAACRGYDPELFFPIHGEDDAEEAKRICRPCPVQWECGEYATETNQAGVWGGLTQKERTTRKRRALARKPTGATT